MELSGREDLGVWPWILGERSTVDGPKNGMKRPKKEVDGPKWFHGHHLSSSYIGYIGIKDSYEHSNFRGCLEMFGLTQ